MSADMEWTGMPDDKLTWLLFDLWGDQNIDQAWSDTSAFLNRLSEEWGVSGNFLSKSLTQSISDM